MGYSSGARWLAGFLKSHSNGMLMNPGKESRGWLACAVFVFCALAPAVVRAETDAEKKAQAKELFERATRLYDVGKYGEAISTYEEAYLLVEDPVLLFNMGQAYRLWDRPEEAIRSYKNYLRKRPDATNRADVERKIADLERVVDERRRGGVPAAPMPAPHPAPTPSNGYPEQPAPEQIGNYPQPEPTVGPAPSENQPAGVAVAHPPSEPPRAKRNWLAYGLLAGGGTCLVISALAAAAGQQASNKLRDASQNHQPFDPTVESNGKAANTLAYVALATGVVAGGIGGYLLWRGRSAQGSTVSLVPTLTPSYAGGSAVVSF
jgi:tetratricopeptide (TPR) repeat protein